MANSKTGLNTIVGYSNLGMTTTFKHTVITATANGSLRLKYPESVPSSVQLTGNYYLTLGWLVNAGRKRIPVIIWFNLSPT